MTDLDAATRAGVAVYNAGFHHAAHDAWEDAWLDLTEGSDDERFLHGLIQFTAAVHHGDEGNWDAVASLAESAGEYLADLPETYRGVAVGAVRDHLATLAGDPRALDRSGPPPLRCDGAALDLPGLDSDAALAAAEPLAEGLGHDESVVADAVRYASEDRGDGGRGRFRALVADYVRDADHRALVFRRLSEHVERRRAKERDVDGLF